MGIQAITKFLSQLKAKRKLQSPTVTGHLYSSKYPSACTMPQPHFKGMILIFFNMMEDTMEVFMDYFLVIWDSFNDCLGPLTSVMKRCEETNLVLSSEK